MSLKYQVLCDQTAIIGVCKQENKTSGEVQESTIEFGKSAAPEPEMDDDDMFEGGFMARGATINSINTREAELDDDMFGAALNSMQMQPMMMK